MHLIGGCVENDYKKYAQGVEKGQRGEDWEWRQTESGGRKRLQWGRRMPGGEWEYPYESNSND